MLPLKQLLKLTLTKSPPWIMKSFITLQIKSVKKEDRQKKLILVLKQLAPNIYSTCANFKIQS